MNYELAKLRETSVTKVESMEKRVKLLERTVEERDISHRQIIDAYEARLAKTRADL